MAKTSKRLQAAQVMADVLNNLPSAENTTPAKTSMKRKAQSTSSPRVDKPAKRQATANNNNAKLSRVPKPSKQTPLSTAHVVPEQDPYKSPPASATRSKTGPSTANNTNGDAPQDLAVAEGSVVKGGEPTNGTQMSLRGRPQKQKERGRGRPPKRKSGRKSTATVEKSDIQSAEVAQDSNSQEDVNDGAEEHLDEEDHGREPSRDPEEADDVEESVDNDDDFEVEKEDMLKAEKVAHISGKRTKKFNARRWRKAIALHKARNEWQSFHTALCEIYDKRTRVANRHSQSKVIARIRKPIKEAQSAFLKMEKAEDSCEDIGATLVQIDQLQADLTEQKMKSEAEKTETIIGIYVRVIPELGLLLRCVLMARYEADGLSIDSMAEIVALTDLIVKLCNRARDWALKPPVEPLIKLTKSLKVHTEGLNKRITKELQRAESRVYEHDLQERRGRIDQEYEEEEKRRLKQAKIDADQRMREIAFKLELNKRRRTYPREASEMIMRAASRNSEPMMRPSTPEHLTRRGPSPEIGSDDQPIRTPLTVISGRSRRPTHRASPSIVQEVHRETNWTPSEENALITGLQEFQGPSRYFEIFKAYSGRGLGEERDMDAIERKAKLLRGSLMNEFKDRDDYHDFDFLWSVE